MGDVRNEIHVVDEERADREGKYRADESEEQCVDCSRLILHGRGFVSLEDIMW